MGFSMAAAFVILFASSVAAGTGLFLAVNDYVTITKAASLEQTDAALSRIQTSIKIVNVSGNKIYVENRGSIALDPERISLAVDDRLISNNDFSVTGSGYFRETLVNRTKLVRGAYCTTEACNPVFLTTKNKTEVVAPPWRGARFENISSWFNITVIEKSFVPTNTTPKFYWQPKDVLEITAAVPIVNKTKVIVENGVWSEHYVNVGTEHYHLAPVEEFYPKVYWKPP